MADRFTIGFRAGSRVGNLPSEIGSPQLSQFVEDAAQDISNFTGRSINLDDIGSAFHGVLTDRAAAYVVAKKMGIDIDIDARIGEITATYDNLNRADLAQFQFFAERSRKSMEALGKVIRFDKTEPVT